MRLPAPRAEGRAVGNHGQWVLPERGEHWMRSPVCAVALAQRGVTVNIVSPGATDDSGSRPAPGGLPDDQGLARLRLDAHATPRNTGGHREHHGGAVSEKTNFITGQTIHVDGGASVMDPVFPLAIKAWLISCAYQIIQVTGR